MLKTKTAPSLKSTQRWFKSPRVPDNTGINLDKDKGVLRDVVIAQVGPAEGHGTNVEQQFINELVAQGNKASQGIKVHFGHPSMSEQTLGTYAGRASNLRVNGEKAIADITLSTASKLSPKGDIYSYIIGLAEEAPEKFGMSVVTCGNWAYQYDEEGNMYSENDADWEKRFNPDKPVYEMFEQFIDVDFVDQGALTPNGLFGTAINLDKFAVGTTDFLNKNPKIDQFLKDNPTKIIEFMSKRYGVEMPLKNKKDLNDLVSKMFSSNNNKMNKKKNAKDINATSDEGVGITIVTTDTAAKVGDSVLETDSGEPADNGDYDIVGGDLDGQTVTVQDGVISEIKPSVPDAADPATDPAKSKKPTLEERFSALETKYSALEKSYSDMKAENEELKKRPKATYTAVIKTKDEFQEEKKEKPVTKYNKQAQELADKRKKRTGQK